MVQVDALRSAAGGAGSRVGLPVTIASIIPMARLDVVHVFFRYGGDIAFSIGCVERSESSFNFAGLVFRYFVVSA